jgi:hypothetical protein
MMHQRQQKFRLRDLLGYNLQTVQNTVATDGIELPPAFSGQAPAESDLERYFRVSPPAIHNMIKTPERNGLIERTPGQARSIRVLVRPEHLPRLE